MVQWNLRVRSLVTDLLYEDITSSNKSKISKLEKEYQKGLYPADHFEVSITAISVQ